MRALRCGLAGRHLGLGDLCGHLGHAVLNLGQRHHLIDGLQVKLRLLLLQLASLVFYPLREHTVQVFELLV